MRSNKLRIPDMFDSLHFTRVRCMVTSLHHRALHSLMIFWQFAYHAALLDFTSHHDLGAVLQWTVSESINYRYY
jgi:hypothetical protein